MLGEKVEIILMWASNPPDIVKIRKLIVSPEEWDGNIWGDSHDNEPREVYSLSSNSTVYEARPIIKTEVTTGPWCESGDHTWKTTPLYPIQMADLQEHHDHKPGETGTEYLWWLCLTGGDRNLLNGNKANGIWGPGVLKFWSWTPRWSALENKWSGILDWHNR